VKLREKNVPETSTYFKNKVPFGHATENTASDPVLPSDQLSYKTVHPIKA